MFRKKIKVPSLTVDGVIVLADEKIVLIQRKYPPFQNAYALPGGFVDYGETVEHALLREMKEETGLDVEIMRIIGVYSEPDRDPRRHTVTIAYECRVPASAAGHAVAGDDAKNLQVLPITDALALPLAFDHSKILGDFVKNLLY